MKNLYAQTMEGVIREVEGDESPGLAFLLGVSPGQQLTVWPGDKVRVTATVQYMGPALSDTFYVAIGQRHPVTGFAEWWVAQVSISFTKCTSWTTFTLTADVQIPTSETANNLCDVYCKIKGHTEAGLPEYDGVINVVAAAQFQNFKITDYSKV